MLRLAFALHCIAAVCVFSTDIDIIRYWGSRDSIEIEENKKEAKEIRV